MSNIKKQISETSFKVATERIVDTIAKHKVLSALNDTEPIEKIFSVMVIIIQGEIYKKFGIPESKMVLSKSYHDEIKRISEIVDNIDLTVIEKEAEFLANINHLKND